MEASRYISCMSLLRGIFLIWFPVSRLLDQALSIEIGGSAHSDPINRDAKACNFNQILTQSYYERYNFLDDLDFDTFLSQEIPCGICEVLPDNHKSILKVSDLERNLVGEGSHRHLSTSIKFQTQPTNSVSERINYSCQLIIIERLPSGVFADPFELQHLVQRRVFHDIAVFGDTNLELPSFMSNRSAVEIHLNVDPNIFYQSADINLELPLHARYQPLNESGYSTVKFGTPDVLVHCGTRENVENQSCFSRATSEDAKMSGGDIVWRIPCGRKAHALLVSTFTFLAALLSTLVIVCTALCHSNVKPYKGRKQA
ncbi:phosphatidylinositol-glycan biosynthesis class X protein-like [Neltuma alba]|uniref:phosphatidylinositol-glycan biosynthesis class X protein-like n=1 Tax=Neltuma alba TaxID=207710 RepID=UPI0010A46F58|nr:phosphatidylinositol-glycan biosynthesis class X protein-like [Prosopis alba]XP_028754638.1 phosphatidylinositol-glycan biosynthesis class X protein-like [Prosopis alba]